MIKFHVLSLQLKLPISLKLSVPSFSNSILSTRLWCRKLCQFFLSAVPLLLACLAHYSFLRIHLKMQVAMLAITEVFTWHSYQSQHKGLCFLSVCPPPNLSLKYIRTHTYTHKPTHQQTQIHFFFQSWIWRPQSYDYCASPRKLAVYFCCLSGSLTSLAT